MTGETCVYELVYRKAPVVYCLNSFLTRREGSFCFFKDELTLNRKVVLVTLRYTVSAYGYG